VCEVLEKLAEFAELVSVRLELGNSEVEIVDLVQLVEDLTVGRVNVLVEEVAVLVQLYVERLDTDDHVLLYELE
jgi:hypothetical protein